MKFSIDIMGKEGLLYHWISEYIEPLEFSSVIYIYFANNKHMLSSQMELESIATITTYYDDGDTDSVSYHKKDFDKQFQTNDLLDQ